MTRGSWCWRAACHSPQLEAVLAQALLELAVTPDNHGLEKAVGFHPFALPPETQGLGLPALQALAPRPTCWPQTQSGGPTRDRSPCLLEGAGRQRRRVMP